MSSGHRFKRMVSSPAADSSDTVLQKITAQKSRAAIFLVLTINPDPADAASVLTFGPDLSALVRAVGFGYPEAGLSCVMGFGSQAWDRLLDGAPRPLELHPFREYHAEPRCQHTSWRENIEFREPLNM